MSLALAHQVLIGIYILLAIVSVILIVRAYRMQSDAKKTLVDAERILGEARVNLSDAKTNLSESKVMLDRASALGELK